MLTDDLKKGIAIGVIAESTIYLVRAMVDVTNSETCITIMRPYFKHAGIAAALLMKNRVGTQKDDLTTIQLMLTQTAHCFSSRGTRNTVVGEDISSFECTDCTYCDGPPELCTMICDIAAESFCSVVNPAYEMKLLEMQSKGSSRCYAVVRHKGSTNTTIKGNNQRILNLVMNEEEMFAWQMQYMGEIWVLVTRGFAEFVEPQAMLRVLLPQMKLIGLNLGNKILPLLSSNNRSIEYTAEIARLFGRCIGQNIGELIEDNLGLEWNVLSCPFSDAPDELCHQLEGITNGMCSSVNPHFHFSVDLGEKCKRGCVCRIQELLPSRLDRLY